MNSRYSDIYPTSLLRLAGKSHSKGVVGKLVSFRNVLFSPLSPLVTVKNSMSKTLTAAEMSSGFASSAVSLHDHHNVEVKTVSELSSTHSLVETDIYLFVPKNFELTGHGKTELVKDFRSRVRLAVPVGGDQGAQAFDDALESLRYQLRALEEAERSGEAVHDLNHAVCEQVLETAKDISAVLAETIKHRTIENTRRFLISQNLMSIPSSALAGLDQLMSDISSTSNLLTKLRTAIDSNQQSASAILTFLDEYMSHLYVQYLGSVRTELARTKAPRSTDNDTSYVKGRINAENLLTTLQEKEARHRQKFGVKLEIETDLDREHRLVRLSHLKKFFQSKTFVDITRQQPATKISESTATIGTAFAAIIAAMLDFYGRSATSNAAMQGLFVITFGVILYVFRDRMKDRAKTVFHKKALQFLPDFEQKLVAKDINIGRVKEWFHILKSKDTPLDVLSRRRAAASTELERRIPEDVFHCRKIQEVDASSLLDNGKKTQSRALYENTRINFERYLKHMDDAFKDLTDLDPNGHFLSSRSHRVYHFYLCIKTITGPIDKSMSAKLRPMTGLRETANTQTLLYRIVLDKTGVVRLENIG